jgi:signal peptidase I
MKIKNFVLEIIETILVSGAVILVLYHFIASVEVVWGPSMEPNYHSGERILVDRITKNISPLKRGEVVVFYPPSDDSKHYIKRVVGIPGDIFKIINCEVVVTRNGEHYFLDEEYLSDSVCTEAGSSIREGRSIKLEEGEYVLLGDNRGQSLDSRNLGTIEKDRIIGRVVFRFWPPEKIGFVR